MKSVPLKFVLTGALAVVLGSTAIAQSDDPVTPDSHTSHTPPVGPPWVRDFAQARTQALKSGKPIFLYSTKTY